MKQSQTERLYELLKEGFPVRTDQIVRTIYGEGMSLARVGARIWDIKKKYGVEVKGWHDKTNTSLYWYQIVKNEAECGILSDETNSAKAQEQNTFAESNRQGGQGFAGLLPSKISSQEVRKLWGTVPSSSSFRGKVQEREITLRDTKLNLSMF